MIGVRARGELGARRPTDRHISVHRLLRVSTGAQPRGALPMGEATRYSDLLRAAGALRAVRSSSSVLYV